MTIRLNDNKCLMFDVVNLNELNLDLGLVQT